MKYSVNLFYGQIFRRFSSFSLILLILSTSAATAQDIEPGILQLINKSEKSMGGRANYNRLKHLSWNFFNNRVLTWNKYTGDVRIDMRNENSVYLVNIHSKEGKVLKNGEEITQPDSLKKYLNSAYEMWVNDSYWLVMPWKLKDPGVHHVFVGDMASLDGAACSAIQISFENTGVTPDNKYLIYFDKETGLIRQWDFFRRKSDAAPLFSSIWGDYKEYAGVQLSGDRGERDITDIRVFDKLPESVYTAFKRPFYLTK